MKREKREIRLLDELGATWVEATLTEPAIKRMIREYQKQGIWLEVKSA